MPFTIAHPLLPVLINKAVPRLSLSAMVAGSIVPDMENFIKLHDSDSVSHTWQGVFMFDWPLSLLLCILYHGLVRNPFIANLPSGLRSRLMAFTTYNWFRYALAHQKQVLISLLIGTASHLLWDSFTHHDGLMVSIIPVLAEKIRLVGTQYPVFYLLQLISSIGGMILLLWFIHLLPKQAEREDAIQPDQHYWIGFILFALLLLTVRLMGWPELNSYLGIWRAVMGAILYAWLLVSVIFYKPAIRLNRWL